MLAGHGLDVVVLTGRIESDERISGVTLHDSPQLFNRDASMDVRLGEALTSRPAVVHLHQIDDPDVVARMRTVAPVVSSAHGYSACTSGVYYFGPGQECTRAHGPMCVVNLLARGCAHTRHPKSLPARYARVTGRLRALVQADLVVSYSSSVDRHLAANGLTRRAIVPYFPTMAHKSGSGHAARRRVVFAGRVVAPKGVGVLLRAASDVDGEFVICGDGTRLEPMRRLARRLKLEQRVRFTGWLDAEDLAQELADASVVVVPSLWPEPFGLVGIEALAAGRPVRSVPVPEAAADAPRKLSALSSKPVLYVANVEEGKIEVPEALAAHAEAAGAASVALSARIESELVELDAEEAAEMRAELGLHESGLERLVHAAFELLDLIVFFTADTDKEATARSLPRGGTAYEAAGKVHGEIQERFVRAEVIGWDALIEAGGYVAAADRGLIRTEGRDYVVADGDVIHIKT